MSDIPEPIDDFAEAFTLYVASWNLLEMSAQTVLVALLGRTGAALAVSVEMKNTSLTHAIKAAAKLDDRSAECVAAVERFVDVFERLREHRNFTVHSFVCVVDGSGKSSAGFRMLIQAKGTLKHADMPVEAEALWDFIDHHDRASDFALELDSAIRGEKPFPSLDTLPLPERLEKTLHNLEPYFPRPEASPE